MSDDNQLRQLVTMLLDANIAFSILDGDITIESEEGDMHFVFHRNSLAGRTLANVYIEERPEPEPVDPSDSLKPAVRDEYFRKTLALLVGTNPPSHFRMLDPDQFAEQQDWVGSNFTAIPWSCCHTVISMAEMVVKDAAENGNIPEED